MFSRTFLVALKKTFEDFSAKKEWLKWCNSLLELYETEKQFYKNGQIYKMSFLGLKRWIIAEPFTGSSLLLKNLLLDAIMSAEKIPGAGVYVPWFLYNQLDLNSSAVVRQSSEDYLRTTLMLTKNKFVKQVFETIHGCAGPMTKIIIKPSLESDVVIKYRNSFCFPLELDPQFSKMIGYTELIEQANPIVIMIEGAPETVGEISSLLEWNHDTSRPVILIARSFPEEISATLATNWIRNSLSIVPLVYGDKIATINLAADMCTITKGELISPHFGDVIPAAIRDEDKWGTVDKAEWTSRGLFLFKETNASKHVEKLLSKIKDETNEELIEVIQNRVLSMSNDALEVWIPKHDYQLLEELDSLIKHYNGYIISGAINTPLGYVPKSFISAAQTASQSFREKILNIGGFLVRTDNEMVVGRRR